MGPRRGSPAQGKDNRTSQTPRPGAALTVGHHSSRTCNVQLSWAVTCVALADHPFRRARRRLHRRPTCRPHQADIEFPVELRPHRPATLGGTIGRFWSCRRYFSGGPLDQPDGGLLGAAVLVPAGGALRKVPDPPVSCASIVFTADRRAVDGHPGGGQRRPPVQRAIPVRHVQQGETSRVSDDLDDSFQDRATSSRHPGGTDANR